MPFALMLRGAAALFNPWQLLAPYRGWACFISNEVTILRVAVMALVAIVTKVGLAIYTQTPSHCALPSGL